MTKSVYFMEIGAFRGCGWSTVALGRVELGQVQEAMRTAHPGQALVMSCQRVEAYGFGECGCEAPLTWRGREAVDHLAEVAAGLHSAVLGEAQILGQVREGFAEADGGVRRFGDIAIAAAREMRRKTAFNSHAGHLLDRALKVARMPVRGRTLVLGTGQMGRLVAERAMEIGFDEVIVAGRARRAAIPGMFVALSRVGTVEDVDVVVACLGSGADEIQIESLPAAALYVDLGTPRNFARVTGDGAPASGHGGPRLLGIADLLADEAKRPHAKRRRAALARELRGIVSERLTAAEEDGQSAVGLLRARVEAVRRREVERMRRLHPDVPEAAIEAMTRSLVNQLFHGPTRRLREVEGSVGREFVALFE
jgi:glutamyl-tRNA reductase